MKISVSWLKELVNLNCSIEEFVTLLPLRTIGTKEVTDSYIELDMKGYNRADLLSLRGVAYEVAAITGSSLSFKEPKESEFIWSKERLPTTPVGIGEEKLSRVQCVAKIEGLSFGQSPKEWVEKLEISGMRSVNNIVDVTNLIMFEYGQPLHSFDASTIKDKTINVRRAKNGEEITTLDGKLRKLTTEDIVLADTEKAIDIAGIMGGKDTETRESTQTILLTASLFDAQMVMKTANKLGLHSEASKRFQHGLTKKRLLQALDAAIKMYGKLGGKVTAITITGNFEDGIKKIKLTQQKIDSLIGVEMKSEEVEAYLNKLGFKVTPLRSIPEGYTLQNWEITAPYYRLDVEIEEDVIEEVARMYGYEKIPATAVSESKPLQKEDPIFQKISTLKKKLVGLGLTEVQTYSFYSTDVLNALNSEREQLVKVANPISSETEYLRQNLWPNMVEVVGKNIRKGYKDIAIFEIGKSFNNRADGPREEYRLSIALMNGSNNPLAELYQIAQKITDTLGVKLVHLRGVQSLFHPKRYLILKKKDEQLGHLAETHLRVLNRLGIEKRVAVLEMAL